MRTIHHAFLALILSTFVSASFADESKGSSDLTSKVIGTYEFKCAFEKNAHWKFIFYKNGALQRWKNGKLVPPGVWSLEGNEIHVKWADTAKSVGIVNKDSIKIQYWITANGKKNTGGNTWKKVK
tara:strand:- start:691 stop:1065 length:375 start_codon:yes stop_codon:yes gene_type:complete